MRGGASCGPPPPLTWALGVSLIPSPSSTHTESRLQTHRPRESHIPLFAESKSLRSKLLHQPFRTPPPYPPFITDKPDENDYWNSSRYRWFILSSHRHLHVDGFQEHEHEADGEEVVDRDRDHTTARLSFAQLKKMVKSFVTGWFQSKDRIKVLFH